MAKNDKKKSIYTKPEKVKKPTLMLLKSKHKVVEGKDYYIVLND